MSTITLRTGAIAPDHRFNEVWASLWEVSVLDQPAFNELANHCRDDGCELTRTTLERLETLDLALSNGTVPTDVRDIVRAGLIGEDGEYILRYPVERDNEPVE